MTAPALKTYRKLVAGGIDFKDAAAGSMRATFATFGTVDHDGDVTLPGAFPVGRRIVVGQWNHATTTTGALPVGTGVIQADSKRAWVDASLFVDTTAGSDTYKVLKALGPLAEFSYGFLVKDASFDRGELAQYGSTARRILKSLDVFEVSPVLRGAGIDTGLDYIKRTERINDAELAAMRERLESMRLKKDILTALDNADRALHPRQNYIEVEANRVDAGIRKVAHDALAWARKDLGLTSGISIRWFEPESLAHKAYRVEYGAADWEAFQNRNVAGLADVTAKEIWIRSDLPAAEVIETVAHECKHIALGAASTDEGAAAAYGMQARMRLTTG